HFFDGTIRRADREMGRAEPAQVPRHRATRAHARVESLCDPSAAPGSLPQQPSGAVQTGAPTRRPYAVGGHDVVHQSDVATKLLERMVRLHHRPHSWTRVSTREEPGGSQALGRLRRYRSAPSKSLRRSRTSSMPTLSRISASSTPRLLRISTGMLACVMVAGWPTRDSTPP